MPSRVEQRPCFWGQVTTTEHRERLLLPASEVAFALEEDRRGALGRVRVMPRRDREHEARAHANSLLLQEVLREAARSGFTLRRLLFKNHAKQFLCREMEGF